MNKIAKCQCCGEEFVKKVKIQRFCCDACRRKAYNESPKMKEHKAPKVNVTMDMMLDAMLRLSKERGRVVQYGQVQKELLTGKLYVRGGVIVG